ncbi:MAG: periplasmic heavy metal sensor [Verrucomicrobia bacterium]|nr:periplasmic heavy metal sensor [Verrucomicrobiota bacterium]
MRSTTFKLVVVALVILAAFAACYFGARWFSAAIPEGGGELAWLQTEFRLGDGEMQRIRQLHEGYMPKCEEMCARIAAKNGELNAALGGATNVSAEVRQKLAEVAVLRAECQAKMLAHFYEVSHAMPPAQGARYLAEMKRLTLGLHARQEESMTGTNAHVRP